MTAQQIILAKEGMLNLLENKGGMIRGHYPQVTSRLKGFHINYRISSNVLSCTPTILDKVFQSFISTLTPEEKNVDGVIGAYPNSAFLIEGLSDKLTTEEKSVLPYYVHTGTSHLKFYELNEIKDKKFLFVSDVLLSGTLAQQIYELVTNCGGEIVASVAIVDASRESEKGFKISHNDNDIRTKSFLKASDLEERFDFWCTLSKDCPLCNSSDEDKRLFTSPDL